MARKLHSCDEEAGGETGGGDEGRTGKGEDRHMVGEEKPEEDEVTTTCRTALQEKEGNHLHGDGEERPPNQLPQASLVDNCTPLAVEVVLSHEWLSASNDH